MHVDDNPRHAKKSALLPILALTLPLVVPIVAQGAEATGPCDDLPPPEVCEALELPSTNPAVTMNFAFGLENCVGVREALSDDTTTTNAGLATNGRFLVFLISRSHTSIDKGWGWTATCDLKIFYAYAQGSGSALREVSVRARNSASDSQGEASCVYDGVQLSGCRTEDVLSGTFKVEISGHTMGYPTSIGAEGQAYALNKAQYDTRVCTPDIQAESHSCVGLFPQVVHAPVIADTAAISWTETTGGAVYEAVQAAKTIIDPQPPA